jgi:hypothetical protein
MQDVQCLRLTVGSLCCCCASLYWLQCNSSELKAFSRNGNESKLSQQQEFLQLILGFVGGEEFLVMSLVSSTWRAAYKASAVSCEHCHHELRCTYYTSYTAVFASIARLHVAYDLGLRQILSKQDCSKIEFAAGRHAAVQTLQEAVVLGLSPTCSVAQGAIESSDVQKLRWLCIEQQCPLPQDATLIAAKAKSTDMLRWLQQSGCVCDEHRAMQQQEQLPTYQCYSC